MSSAGPKRRRHILSPNTVVNFSIRTRRPGAALAPSDVPPLDLISSSVSRRTE